MIELEADHFDEQLTRAVATRADMLQRQGIDGALAYSRDVVRQIKHEQACAQAHDQAGIAIKALVCIVAVCIWFAWFA